LALRYAITCVRGSGHLVALAEHIVKNTAMNRGIRDIQLI
jgi:hypothetical protein